MEIIDLSKPLPYSKDLYNWQPSPELWYSVDFESPETGPVFRHAFKVPFTADLPEPDSGLLFGDIGFWGTTYNLKKLRIYKGKIDMFIYLETVKATDFSFLLEIIARVLKSDSVLTDITEAVNR